MAKKSAAQLRRLKKRAEQRGEEYIEPEPSPEEENPSTGNDNQNKDSKNGSTAKPSTTKSEKDLEIESKFAAAEKLQSELKSIEENDSLKSKDRRSAKRKAEAIAFETTGVSADDLLKWYEKEQEKRSKKQGNNKDRSQNDNKKESSRKRHDPYIAFFGQLSFETTKDDLLQHIKTQLKESYPPSQKKSIQIRMLTHSQTQQSRGMAFVQVDDPEFLYALLKLHQTYLKGRRINVEKSAGGKKGSESRKAKIQAYRKEQETYFAEVVDNILGEYKKTGEIRDDELDDGVVQMCRRHSGPVVKAAITEYVEKGGNQMDNPSAYLTFLVSKFAKEGIHDEEDTGKTKKTKNNKRDGDRRQDSTTTISRKRSKPSSGHGPIDDKDWKHSSKLANMGVDMSLSDKPHTNDEDAVVIGASSSSSSSSKSGPKDLASIFPSSQRGRARGYMRNVRR